MTANHACKYGIILCKHQFIILSAPPQGNSLQAFPCTEHLVSTNIHVLLIEKHNHAHTHREKQEDSFGALIFYLTYLLFISIYQYLPPKMQRQADNTAICYDSMLFLQ